MSIAKIGQESQKLERLCKMKYLLRFHNFSMQIFFYIYCSNRFILVLSIKSAYNGKIETIVHGNRRSSPNSIYQSNKGRRISPCRCII